MKKILLTIFLASAMILPLSMSAESRGNNHRQHNTEQSGKRGNGNNNRSGNNNRPGNNSSKPGNNRPGNNNWKPGNNKPGNNNGKPGNNKPGNNKGHDKDKWGGNSHKPPGGNVAPQPAPGRPQGWRPGGNSVKAPGYRPGHYNHPPRLGKMVKHAVGHGRYDRVWMVAPGQYAVRFFNNGYYYMQYIWPESGRYGAPFRIVMNAPGQWYAYNNMNQWYYDDGNTLRISLNGSPMNPWTLIPSVELNINL